MGIPATEVRFGGWTVGPVVGRRPAGVARDAVHPGTGAHAVLVVVDERFTDRMPPDAEAVARAALVGAAAVVPMLDAGLLDDGTRWYVTPAAPGPVLDPAAGCSPRRAVATVEAVARALAAVHAAGLVHGLVGPQSVVPAAGRHAERPVPATLLLDTGVAALLGDRAADLAAASGVVLPRDRGAAADVHALGGLLLRLLTAAAPAGPALAALPVPLRALLSEMLDDDPSRRPAAGAVAARLGALRDGLLATGPVELPGTGAQPVPRASAPVPVVPAARPTGPAPVLPRPTQEVPLPAPVRAPVTLDALVDEPDRLPSAAPSLRTGPVAIRSDGRPVRRRGRTALLAAGGVGLAGLLVGVLTHLPTGQEAGVGAVVAAAKDGVLGARPAPSDAVRTSAPQSAEASRPASAAPTGRARHRAVPAAAAPAAAAPAFVRPTTLVPSPLAASATSPTPSRSTPTAPRRATGPTAPSSAPASSAPSAPSAPSGPSGGGSSAPVSSAPVPSAPPEETAPTSSAPTETPAGTPTPTDTPTATPTPTAAPTESAAPDETVLPTGPLAE